MRKKVKKLVVLLLISCLLVCTVGCGKKDNDVVTADERTDTVDSDSSVSEKAEPDAKVVENPSNKAMTPADETDGFVALSKAIGVSKYLENFKFASDISVDCTVSSETDGESFGMDFAVSMKESGEYASDMVHISRATAGRFFGFSESEKEEYYADLIKKVAYTSKDTGKSWESEDISDKSLESIITVAALFNGGSKNNYFDLSSLVNADTSSISSENIQALKDEVGIKDCIIKNKNSDGSIDVSLTMDASKLNTSGTAEGDEDNMFSSIISDPSELQDFSMDISIDNEYRVTHWGIDLSNQIALMDGTADTFSALSSDEGAQWSTEIKEFYVKCDLSDFDNASVAIPDDVINGAVSEVEDDEDEDITWSSDTSLSVVGSNPLASNATIEEEYLGTSGLDVNTICEKCGFSKDLSTEGKYYQFAITFGNMVQTYTEEEVIDSAKYFSYSTMREQVALVLLSRLGMEDFNSNMLESIVSGQNGGTRAYEEAVEVASKILEGTYEIQ